MAAKEDRRNELFTLRLSPDEREKLEQLSQSQGTGVAEVLRVAVNALCDTKGIDHVFREKGGAG